MRRTVVVAVLVTAILALPATAGVAEADGNEAPGGPLRARAITGGREHTCVLRDDRSLVCWGQGVDGELGSGDQAIRGDEPGDMGDALDPVDVGTGRRAVTLTSGSYDTCAILDNGSVKCWGAALGGIGYGEPFGLRGDQPGEMGDNLPAIDLGTGRTATAITASHDHICAILDTGQVKCWGTGSSGELGTGDGSTRGDQPGEMGNTLPAIDLGTGRTATAITAGNQHTCAILDTGQVKCWGYGGLGQLGIGDASTRGDQPGEMGNTLPAIDLGTGRTATAITAGDSYTCARLDNGTVKCWGHNGAGELGQGDTNNRGDQPAEMGNNLAAVELGTGRTAVAVAAGGLHTCAILDNATVKCWGYGGEGRLGAGDTLHRGDGPGEMGDSLPTVDLGPGRSAIAVTAGHDHTCAVLDNGSVKCWGFNAWGQLGQGDTNNRGDEPNEMGGLLRAVELGDSRTAVPLGVTAAIAADQAQVVAGQPIDYHITLTNTGGRTLTNLQVLAPDVPTCAQTLPSLAPGAATVLNCAYTTGPDDVPQMTNQVLVTTRQGAFALSGTRRTRVAGPVRRPDARIRVGAGTPVGDNVYNTTGAGQARSASVPNLGTATYTVTVQNDGNTTGDITVQGLGSSTRFAVTYKDGDTNITSQVVAGTFTLADLAPGATHDLTLLVKAKAGTPRGSALTRVVAATSVEEPGQKDAVKATVTRR